MNLLSQVDKLAKSWLEWRTFKALENIEDPEFTQVELRRGQIDILLSHPAVAILASECASFLQAHNAPNFVQMELMPRLERGARHIVVTVAYADGEMPARQIARLKKEVERLVWLCERESE